MKPRRIFEATPLKEREAIVNFMRWKMPKTAEAFLSTEAGRKASKWYALALVHYANAIERGEHIE